MTFPIFSGPKPVVEKSIRSSFADDPDMAELVEMFVEDVPLKIEQLNCAIGDQDIQQVFVFAHQLKGSAAGYGFAALSDLARELETVASKGELAEIAGRGQRVLDYLSLIRM